MIEYDETDYEILPMIGGKDVIFIYCPVCDGMIEVGFADEL